MPEKSRTRTLMDTQHVKQSEKLHNLHGSIFARFFDHSERKSAQKTLF